MFNKRMVFSLLVAVSLSAMARTQARAADIERTLTFSEAYKSILDKSLRLKTQGLEIEASEARRKERIGAFLPTVYGEAANLHGAEPFDYGSRSSAQLRARVNLLTFGSDVAGLEAANKDRESSREKLSREKQLAEEEAAKALIQFMARARQRQITKRVVDLKAESLRIARERFDKGLMPQQEVDKVAIELELSKARLTDAEALEAEARAQLESALGSDRVLVDVLVDWPWKDALSQGSGLDKWTFDLQQRPDWRSARATYESETFRKRSVMGALLPSLDLEGAWGNADLSQPDRRDWTAIVRLTVPLFDSYKSLSSYRLQVLNEQRAAIRLEELKRQAPSEVESLRQNFKAARLSALSREKTAQVTEKLYADNLQRFRLGRASANELAQDQSRLFDAQLSEVDGWSNAHLTFVRLCHGLGGFVEADGKCTAESTNL